MSTAQRLISAADQAAARQARFNGRNRLHKLALFLSLAAMGFGLFWLAWILWETLHLGLGGLDLALFSQMAPPPNEEGGLANAIFGSMVMVALANEFAEASDGLHQASLIYLGLVLFFITFVVLSISKLLLNRLKKNEGKKS